MVIFPLAPDQTIDQMWSNGARGGRRNIGTLQLSLFIGTMNIIKKRKMCNIM